MSDVIVPVVLAGGIDTKTDDKSVSLDKLLVLENGTFETVKKIKPRFGHDSLGNSIVGGGAFANATGIIGNQNTNQLFTYADNTAYGYSVAESAFKASGSAYPVTCNGSVIFDGAATPTNTPRGDMCVVGGYEIYTYTTSAVLNGTTDVQILIRDSATTNVLYQTNTNAGFIFSKLLTWNGFAYLFKWGPTSGDIVFDKINPALTSPIVSTITITRGSNLNSIDAMVTAAGIYIAYYQGNNTIRNQLYDANLGLLHTTDLTLAATSSSFRVGMGVAYDASNGNFFVAFGRFDLYFAVLNSAFTVITTQTKVNAADPLAGSSLTKRVTAYCTAANQVTILAQAAGSSAGQSVVSKYNVSSTATTFTDYSFCETGWLNSKIGQVGSKFYVVLAYDSNQATHPGSPIDLNSGQNTFYLQEVTTSGSLDVNTLGFASRFLIGNALPTGSQDNGPLCELFASGSSLLCNLPTISSLAVKTGNPFAAINKEEFKFSDADHRLISTIPDLNVMTSGGMPLMIDNQSSEQLFNVFPEAPTLTPVVSTGNMALGTYQYFAVYEWIDARGQVHQSSPSVPESVTLTGTQNAVTIQWYQFLNTSKLSNIRIVFYRTAANGATAFRIKILQTNTNGNVLINPGIRTEANSIGSDEDDNSDAQIGSNQILYTTGGILPNDPAPNCSFQWFFKNRVFLGGLDDGNQVWFSKTRIAGEPVKFSAEFFLQVDISGGGVTAGGTLDDKCVFFKKNKIFYMYGDGPNDAGGGSTFSVPQEISSPVGSQYPKSVIQMPLGLMFKSEKGIYLLDRGLTVPYIGAPVAAFNQYSVTASVHVAKFNQVRFFLDNGQCLMYDYFVNQWSVFTGLSAVGATLFQNEVTYVGSNAITYQEDEAIYLDAGAAVSLTIETPWIKLSGLQGFQRAKQVLLLMDRNSSNSITVQVAYDYESTFYQLPFQWTPAAGDEPDQVRLFLNRQKCESIKLRISDNATATTGQGYSLSEISILAMIKRGQFKLPSTKSVGTTSA